MRFFFHIGYNGTHYRGWQRQPKQQSVQEVVEMALSRILKIPTTVWGCGRTDAQVHASQYFFHIDVEKEWDFDMLFRINKVLPDDIAVFEILPMKEDQHARYDATIRTYDYFIHTAKDPFLNDFSSLYLGYAPDLATMNKAVALLLQYQDYYSFCKTPNGYKHTRCTITSASLFIDQKSGKLRFQISANRFLWGMVRIIMGKLLEIGKGELSLDEFENGFVQRKSPSLLKPAHPQGLYLSKVAYPYLDLPPRTDFLPTILSNESGWQVI